MTEHEQKRIGEELEALDDNHRQHDRRLTIVENEIKHIVEKAKDYITKQEFTPIRMIVYGLAATAMTGLLSAILSKVLVK